MLVLCVAAPLPLADAQFSDTSDTMSFEGVVNSIVAWINNKQDPTTPTGIDAWDNSTLTTTQTDSVAILRLVTNVSVTLTATTQDTLSQTLGATTAVLATYYQVDSDGDGSATTGFLGSETGIGSPIYVGGGSSGYETLNGLTVGGDTFLGAGKTLTYVEQDGNVLITVTCRGWNGEDLGSDSDNTEAPDPGTYTADLTLLATGI
ncbi:hypothetical protein HOK31_23000 [Candidatus Poribacteria bacterium]|jgi:hypothetical protein|nr:hypothetical protein [Candidatus Poribacteria bacterium]MBT5711969.1 hypothetical protein [Candidatus Poribacteria bacterium]